MVLRKNIIKTFMERARKSYQIIDGLGGGFQFADILINCWISFEAFTCLTYEKEGVGERIIDFCDDFQDQFFDCFDNFPEDFRVNLIQLSSCRITDMRPGHELDEPKKIEDIRRLKDIFEVIYQVRNNLFHGGKDVEDESDKIIIQCSAIVLFRILEKFLMDEGHISW